MSLIVEREGQVTRFQASDSRDLLLLVNFHSEMAALDREFLEDEIYNSLWSIWMGMYVVDEDNP